MLSRPTTEQILLDARAELLAVIDPAVADGPAKVAVQMLENVLRNCAARAAHEIAWMGEEGAAMLAFAERVAGTGHGTAALTEAIAAAVGPSSQHLDDVCAAYDRAGRAFGVALDLVMASDVLMNGTDDEADDLRRAGRAVLDARLAHEQQVMGEWSFVGRAPTP